MLTIFIYFIVTDTNFKQYA